MENEQNKIESESLAKRIRFRSLPFDEKQAFTRLANRVKHPIVISYAGKNSQTWKYVSIAASIALLFVLSLYLMDKEPQPALVYYETTAVPDAKTKIVLPDSSVVWLNANASLRYPREFSHSTRQVEMTGEAFFEVRKDDKKPFIVQTDGIGIRVLGTTFNVDAEAGRTEITLLTGKVGLYKKSNRSQTADCILSPGERAVFYSSGNHLAVSTIRPENVTSWITGKFIFRDNSLEEIMQELQRAFHVKIHIENESLRNQTFNADFTGKETLDEILSIMQISARYKIEKRKGEIFLK